MVHDGRMFFIKNHLYVTGSEIEKYGDASYRIKDATATTCDGPIADWRFTSKEGDVTVDGYGTLKNGTFQIRETPVVWFPWAMFPAKTTRQSGFLFPYFGYSADKLGFDVEIPYYWAISDSYDATLYTRYMDKRGLMEGAEFRYHPEFKHLRPVLRGLPSGSVDGSGHQHRGPPQLDGAAGPMVLVLEP